MAGAEMTKTTQDKEKPVKRKCLKCRKYFYSKWIGNRLCDKCKKGTGANMYGSSF